MRAYLIAVTMGVLITPALASQRYRPVTPEISCPGDHVVWVNATSSVYHYQGERWFGRTRHGQFEREKDAEAEGNRAMRNGQ